MGKYLIVGCGLTGSVIGRELAEAGNNLIVCGRLADFKYYNMDQCLERSLSKAKEILSN